MRRILPFLAVWFLCIGGADAAARATTKTNARGNNTVVVAQSQTRSTASRGNAVTNTTRNSGTTTTRNVTTRSNDSVQRATVSRKPAPQTISRTTTQRTTTTRPGTTTQTTVKKSGTSGTRSATKSTSKTNVSRAATTGAKTNMARAGAMTQSYSAGYNSCHDAYFTCMDQFCATANDTYRRCICSSRLTEIKKKQLALSDAADQIQDFQDLNIEAIPKTAAEVNAMVTASRGEYAATTSKDTSNSAQQLEGISTVLASTKARSLSTSGTLDIAGDINAIWATTDLASGVNLANLTGEALYNAVHSQCADLVSDQCGNASTFNMVISAYAMYIENDCSLLANTLDKQKNNTQGTIRETERQMQTARLENYNAHNSTSINDCVAKVRTDITADTACGDNYVHCLDISGLYLNKVTGEPIYSSNFYQLEKMVSLSGDVLTNQTNRMLVAELNRMRVFAEGSLSTCQDLADEVWDEFMRQSITEIYQGQHTRIRQVKDECLDVVNKCYDSQTASLRDFTNTKEQLLLGSQLELSEQLCREKLSTCSNLYGGGTAGMQQLIDTMLHDITSQKISQDCLNTLKDYVHTMCAVPSNDTLHLYPYACRVYAPGERQYATIWQCQNQPVNRRQQLSYGSAIHAADAKYSKDVRSGYVCNVYENENARPLQTTGYAVKYIECYQNSYLSDCDLPGREDCTDFYATGELAEMQGSACGAGPSVGNACLPCPAGATCPGNGYCPISKTMDDTCSDYVGSLYQSVTRYAMQTCMRPSETDSVTDGTSTPISDEVLQAVNTTMDSVRSEMSASLKTECERLGGYWVATPYQETTQQNQNTSASNLTIWPRFYNETGANKKWGYCADPTAAANYYGNTTTITSSEQSDN